MKINLVNEWLDGFHYGGSIIMVSWLTLEKFKSFSFVLLGVGFSISKGSIFEELEAQ